MDSNKIKVSVLVAGQRFNIITDKSEKYVIDIASEIDARINSMCISGEMTRERAAVLTALDYADDSQADKENINAVKEQIKDYLSEIDHLKENNSKLNGDYNKLKEEYERLVADNKTVSDMEKTAEDDRARIAQLEAENKSLSEELERLKKQQAEALTVDMIEDREAPPEKEPVITAEDDLFFDAEEEEPIKPLPQKKKNRHEHNHVNPYKQKAEKENDQKGYTQQRQYSFFDINEE